MPKSRHFNLGHQKWHKLNAHLLSKMYTKDRASSEVMKCFCTSFHSVKATAQTTDQAGFKACGPLAAIWAGTCLLVADTDRCKTHVQEGKIIYTWESLSLLNFDVTTPNSVVRYTNICVQYNYLWLCAKS